MVHSLRIRAFLAPVLAPVLVAAFASMPVACGSSSPGAQTDAGTDSGKSETAAPEGGTAESGAQGDANPLTLPDAGGPITGIPTEKWTWVPFPESKCRDGSSTGIGMNLNPASDKVMIFLEGGGACFNFASCVLKDNPANFSESDFEAIAASSMDGSGLNVGILDRTQAANPVKDWSYVYVPFCTGDVHAGDAVSSALASENPAVPGAQDFMGYTDMQQYLSRLVATFPKASQVLFAGMSAGGFGAAADYELAATAFGKIPVFMLDDSGPFMESPGLATCLQTQLRTLWGLDKTVLADCDGQCTNPASFFLDYAKYIVKTHPNVTFGLSDSTDDDTITQFFGFGYENCTSYQTITEAQFTSALLDIRTNLAAYPNFGEYIIDGTIHTTTQSAAFYTTTAGGGDGGTAMLMTDWVAALLAGHAQNVGP